MNDSSQLIHQSKNNNYIKINNNITFVQHNKVKTEYDLKQNSFDPSKSSPPNEFMNKLRYRMFVYNRNCVEDKSDDSCDNE
jgi:hypothetical protein